MNSATHVANVRELFEIRSRGVVVVTDVAIRDWQAPMRVDDRIEIRNPGQQPIRPTVVGIEWATPYRDDREVAFVVPREITKSMIAIGAELWLLGEPGGHASSP